MAIASGAAGGYPGTSGVAIGSQQTPAGPTGYGASGTGPSFIPEIWSGKLLEKFYDATVLGAISNTDYEGEIKNQGDTVHIRQRPDIVITDYTPDTELAVQRPNAPIVDLTIDYAKYFNTIVDDVYDVQADMDMMSMWAEDASEQMKITIDTEILANVFLGGAAAANIGATAGRLSGDIDLGVTTAPVILVPRAPAGGQTDVTDMIVALGQVLDEQNIPENGRWLVIPAWMSAMIKKSELRDVSLSGDGTSMLRNGRLGMIDRFTLYMSNLLPAGVAGGLAAGETAIFAGHAVAPTFASQLSKMETIRSERTFGQLMRGLQVYGADIVKPEGLVEAIVTKP
tara:strand:- start:8290 stop:9312 length:1023 start_codon:yes stop_codon:yes gene_type:complete